MMRKKRVLHKQGGCSEEGESEIYDEILGCESKSITQRKRESTHV